MMEDEEKRAIPQWRYTAFVWRNGWCKVAQPFSQNIDAYTAAINIVGIKNPHLFKIVKQKCWPKEKDYLAGNVQYEIVKKKY